MPPAGPLVIIPTHLPRADNLAPAAEFVDFLSPGVRRGGIGETDLSGFEFPLHRVFGALTLGMAGAPPDSTFADGENPR